MDMDTTAKLARLKKNIAEKGSMLIAFSGGTDSSLLAVLAHEVLGDKSRCVLLDSPVVPRESLVEARHIADTFGLRLEIIPVQVLDDDRFTQNPAERCYWCKKKSNIILLQRAAELGFSGVADGVNLSDMDEHRPGLVAGTEDGICHPFLDAGITKEELRRIAREAGYAFWNKPSAACLASRFPYGDRITTENLHMIEEAERFLHSQGFRQIRVRLHGTLARIELPKEDMSTILAMQGEVANKLKEIGFSCVTLDLEGYRSGSMDEVLAKDTKIKP